MYRLSIEQADRAYLGVQKGVVCLRHMRKTVRGAQNTRTSPSDLGDVEQKNGMLTEFQNG